MTGTLSLYHKCRRSLQTYLPALCESRVVNLALLLVGLNQAQHVQLPKVAAHLPLNGQQESRIQRLRRFLSNAALTVTALYAPFALQLLAYGQGLHLRLLIDTTTIGKRHLLFIALAYRGRALPLVWKTVKAHGAVLLKELCPLFDQVEAWLPKDCTITLIGDRAFRSHKIMQECRKRRWHFCLRLMCDEYVTLADGRVYQLRDYPLCQGQRRYEQGVCVTQAGYGPVNLALAWDTDAEEAWYIATDESAGAQTLRDYGKRMWIDEMFSDFKGRGFHLDKTHIEEAERLERLILGVALVYVWLTHLASGLVKRGQRKQVDKGFARQLSYFQIGLRWCQHCQAHGMLLPLAFRVYLSNS